MPAEIKRVQPGVFLIFLGGAVTDDELNDQLTRCARAAEADAAGDPIIVFDAVGLTNPLKAARLIPAQLPPNTAHVVTVNNNRSGAVLTERLAQKLGAVPVTPFPDQPAAVAHAKELTGNPLDEWAACDYLE